METATLQRLRSARLRPTMSRVAVLLLIETQAPAWLSAEEIFRVLLQGGHTIGLGTIYRVLQELLTAELLTRKWGLHRKAFYRSPRDDSPAPVLRLICPQRECCVELRDDALLAQLVSAAMQQGIDLADRSLSIRAEAPRSVASAELASSADTAQVSDLSAAPATGKAPARRRRSDGNRAGAQRASSSSPPGQSRM